MFSWFSGRRQQLDELRTACELAMSHLEFQVQVHAARISDASMPHVSYLIILDTAQPIQPAALLSLRGYLSAEIRSTLGWSISPEHIIVATHDCTRASEVVDRTSRADVLAGQLRAAERPPDSSVGQIQSTLRLSRFANQNPH